jgi:hypothetical protein
MLVKTAAAPQTVTDLGEFEAVISSGSIDRQHDIVEPVGMVRALRLWGERPIPLVWDHGRDPHDVIGQRRRQDCQASGPRGRGCRQG